jgi:hypothetical protein
MIVSMFLGEKIHFIKRHLGIMSTYHPQDERQLAREFVLHYLKDDGVFVTRLLSLNSSDLVVTEIINQLWIRYKTANHFYSSSQANQRTNDVNINTSMQASNVNYSNGTMTINDPYRQRTARIPSLPPPPPLPTFVHRSKSQTFKSETQHDNTKSAKDTDV